MTVLEAMAAGKPVLAFNVGGIRDIIRSDKNGVLVKPYDTDKLAQTMLELLDSPSMCSRMSRESERIASDYDWPVITQKYLDLYSELLN